MLNETVERDAAIEKTCAGVKTEKVPMSVGEEFEQSEELEEP